ncbi:MAG: GFA family protein [Phenylobacterium sp.]|uniref:GFA family protein n=1 Tax=Phenylobacterium sp. TaxID=1871053 RepID=UPI0027211760|nr:GFA family protein [Phenylobacterium sp.]MDO8900833.1 GFA family protein [Phenylobacterium sp.]MDP2212937.1 GFA family protein [Phenylobacterium sp.]
MTSSSDTRHLGGCLCGQVRFALKGPLADIQLCHCSQCRRAQGSAFAANIPAAEADLEFVSGAQALRLYESSPGKVRAFCGRCGSPLFSQTTARPGVVRLRAGTLDEPSGAKLGFHIFADSHADWWDIEDDLPRFSQRAPD